LPEVKQLIGSRRKQVVSDTTIERRLLGFTLSSLRWLLEAQIKNVRSSGYGKIKLGSGRKLHVGVVDGTSIGKKLASVFYLLGVVSMFVDVEKIEKMGKELKASWKLVEHHLSKFELLLVDGLYYVKERINWLKQNGKDILIKTKECGLVVLQDAEQLFANRDKVEGIEYYEGVEVREDGTKLFYQVWAVGGLQAEGVEVPLKVAKVVMKNIITEEEEIFYAITTKQDLTGLEMKELAHDRWWIENKGFKVGNALAALKHAFVNANHAWEAMTLILFLGLNLFGILKQELIYEKILQDTRRTTNKYISDLIRRAVLFVYAYNLGGKLKYC
jgi:hypothetical protein